MPDLLTHVLVGYTLGKALSIHRAWSGELTTVVMVGALLPNLTKIQLIIPDASVEALVGNPFSWHALHTLGGVVVTALIDGLFVSDQRRRRITSLLIGGAMSHLLLDSLLIKPSGYAGLLWWPVLTTALPTPGLYVSYDRWLAFVAGGIALSVSLFTRAKEQDSNLDR